MLVFKKLRNRGGLFRRDTVELQTIRPQRAGAEQRLTLAEVRLSTIGISLDQVFSNRAHGGR